MWKDKRDKKRQRNEQDRDRERRLQNGEEVGDKEPEYELIGYQMGCPKFDEYYRKQFAEIITTDEEFKHFKDTLLEKLPVTFRVNPMLMGHERVVDMFSDPNFIENHTKMAEQEEKPEEVQDDGINMGQKDHLDKKQLRTQIIDYSKLKMDCKKFYPQNLVFEMMLPKELLRKNEGLKKVHKLVDESKDSGVITRQELVSMMPPILCDIQSHHSVFDMCAAPGSKTSQALELIMNSHIRTNGQSNSGVPTGFVLANDADHKRAYLLTHQMNRFNTMNVVVSNHNAQEFPSLHFQPQQSQAKDQKTGEPAKDTRFLFDRVMCDVPCSSDAAIRKIPQKWSTWSPRESQSLHPLQLKIASRGLELLKVGGKLSYSTCSLNPIENESVIAALLKQYKGKIRLLDVQLPGFKFQPGLKQWKFMIQKTRAEVEKIKDENAKNAGNSEHKPETFFYEYETLDDVPAESICSGNKTKLVRETMFYNHYEDDIRNELVKCLRVMPHHQNTSGFFITIIEKLAELDEAVLTEKEPKGAEQQKLPLQIQQFGKTKAFSFVRANNDDPDIQFIKSYYGLGDDFPTEQLISNDEHFKKVHFITKAVSDFLYTDSFKHEINLINLGVQVFQRNVSKSSTGECIYRVVQDGLTNLVPYMTKRVVRTKNFDLFRMMITQRYNPVTLEHLKDEEFFKAADDLTTGCFVFVLELPKGHIEALPMHRFQNSLSTMVGKESAFSLQMRYLEQGELEEGKKFWEEYKKDEMLKK